MNRPQPGNPAAKGPWSPDRNGPSDPGNQGATALKVLSVLQAPRFQGTKKSRASRLLVVQRPCEQGHHVAKAAMLACRLGTCNHSEPTHQGWTASKVPGYPMCLERKPSSVLGTQATWRALVSRSAARLGGWSPLLPWNLDAKRSRRNVRQGVGATKATRVAGHLDTLLAQTQGVATDDLRQGVQGPWRLGTSSAGTSTVHALKYVKVNWQECTLLPRHQAIDRVMDLDSLTSRRLDSLPTVGTDALAPRRLGLNRAARRRAASVVKGRGALCDDPLSHRAGRPGGRDVPRSRPGVGRRAGGFSSACSELDVAAREMGFEAVRAQPTGGGQRRRNGRDGAVRSKFLGGLNFLLTPT